MLIVFVLHPLYLSVHFILGVTTWALATDNTCLHSWKNNLILLLDNIDKFGLVLMYATYNQLEVIFIESYVVDACGCPMLLKGIIPSDWKSGYVQLFAFFGSNRDSNRLG